MIKAQLRNIARTTRTEGGSSTVLATGQPLKGNGKGEGSGKGYLVGAVPVEGVAFPSKIVPLDKFSIGVVQRFVASLREAFGESEGLIVGTWVNDGLVYLDASEVYTNKATALKVATERGELAIWDNKTDTEILTKHGKAAQGE